MGSIARAILLALTLWALMSHPAGAQQSDAEPPFRASLKGHATTLWVAMKDRAGGTDYSFVTTRLRLGARLFWRDRLSFDGECDVEAFSGNFVASPQWDAMKNNQADSLWDLSTGQYSGASTFLRQSVRRLSVNYESDELRLTAGKQRIGWGVMRFWRPTDMFNSDTPLQLEPGERGGVDALRVMAPLSRRADIDFVSAPSRYADRAMGAAKVRVTAGEYDLAVMAGRIQGKDVAALSFDGYLGKGGLRGEYLQVTPPGGASYAQWTIGADYSFRGTLTVTAEYLSNGGCVGTGAVPNPFVDSRGLLTTRNSRFLGVGAAFCVTPLVRCSLFASTDLDGGTCANSARLTWSARENVDVDIGCTTFTGPSGGEYSPYPDQLLMQVKAYF